MGNLQLNLLKYFFLKQLTIYYVKTELNFKANAMATIIFFVEFVLTHC